MHRLFRLRAFVTVAVVGAFLGAAGTAKGPASAAEARRVVPGRVEVVFHEQLVRPAPLEYAPRERSRPAVDPVRGWIFVADRFGTLHALDADGGRRWQADVGGPVEAGLILERDRIYVATTRGVILAFDTRTGEEIWRYRAGTELTTTPTVADGRVLIPGLGDTLLVLDADDGEFLWFHRRPRPEGLTIRGAAPATVSGRRVVTAFSDGTVVALDLDDGRTLWTRRVGTGDFADVDARPVIASDRVHVASYAGELFALDLSTGEVEWSRRALTAATSMTRAGEHLLVAAPDRVAAYRMNDGVPVWEARLRGGTPSELLVHRGAVLVGTEEGPLVALDLMTGRPLRAFDPGTGVAAGPAPAPGGAWLWTNGGWLYRLAWPG